MKRRYILLAVTAALVFAVAAGGTLAAQRVESGALTLGLQAANLSIAWQGESTVKSDSEDITIRDVSLMPDDTYEFAANDVNYSVLNSEGNGNMDAYIRVTVTKYWCEDQNGQQKDADMDASLITLESEGKWTTAEDPFAGRTKSETQVFYYKTPLAPGETTSQLLESMTLSKDAGNEYSNRSIRLEAVAEAVQFVRGDNELNKQAILSAWGVYAELDGEGNITSISN